MNDLDKERIKFNTETIKLLISREIIEIILILVIFLSGFIPIVMGIIYHVRENRRIDREEREKAAKAASHPRF